MIREIVLGVVLAVAATPSRVAGQADTCAAPSTVRRRAAVALEQGYGTYGAAGKGAGLDSALRTLAKRYRLLEVTVQGRGIRRLVESDLIFQDDGAAGWIAPSRVSSLAGPAEPADDLRGRKIHRFVAAPDTVWFEDDGATQDVGREYSIVVIGPGGRLRGAWTDVNMGRFIRTPFGVLYEEPAGYFCAWPAR